VGFEIAIAVVKKNAKHFCSELGSTLLRNEKNRRHGLKLEQGIAAYIRLVGRRDSSSDTKSGRRGGEHVNTDLLRCKLYQFQPSW